MTAAKVMAVGRRVEPVILLLISIPVGIDRTRDHGGDRDLRGPNHCLLSVANRRGAVRGTKAGDEPPLPVEGRMGSHPPAQIPRSRVQAVAGLAQEVHFDVRAHVAAPAAD
jgi:hypothetical protein